MILIAEILLILLRVVWWIIVIQAILSWLIVFNVINTNSDPVRQITGGLDKMTEPLYRPIRKFMPDFNGLDLSPLVVLVGLFILERIIIRLAFLPYF